MFTTLVDSFHLVSPHLAGELIRADYRAALVAACRALPFSSTGILECRLAAEAPQVDFSVVLTEDDGSRQAWAELERWLALPSEPATRSAWMRIGAFCRAWANVSELRASIPDVNLEFDLRPGETALPVPSLFFSFARELAMRLGQGSAPAWITADALPLLRGEPIPSEERKALERCLSALPSGAGVCYLAVMIPRHSAPLRLNVVNLPLDGFAGYLERLGRTASAAALQAQVSALAHWVDYFVLTMDVIEQAPARVGLECFLDRQPELHPHWPGLLDHLVTTGQCSPIKRDRLLAWPGATCEADRAGAWPRNLSMAAEVLGPGWVSVLGRRLSHVKQVFQAGRLLETKAYLTFSHHWGRP